MDSDEQLLDAWRAGDKRAGSALFQRHFNTVRRFFANKIDDPADAEELVQRTFMACVEGRDRFEGRSSFRTYLLGIARNQCLTHWAIRRAEKISDDVEVHAIADLTDRPSSILARDATQRMLLEALRHIPLRDQVVVELYYWEELSGRELAEILGVTEETARSRLRVAKQALRKAMRRMEKLTGLPETTDEDLESWARKLRGQLDGE
jgi:RNA polymerase sigma-70 factor (ECF subfamily)